MMVRPRKTESNAFRASTDINHYGVKWPIGQRFDVTTEGNSKLTSLPEIRHKELEGFLSLGGGDMATDDTIDVNMAALGSYGTEAGHEKMHNHCVCKGLGSLPIPTTGE